MTTTANIQIDTQNKIQNPSQSYLFNLIVYSTCQTRTLELKQILERVTEKFPCRIIRIEKSCKEEANEIAVTRAQEKYGKSGQISCDVVNILVSDSQLERVPFIILANIAADLPVYLIWGDDPTLNAPTLKSLESFSSRLIFNSAFLSDNLKNFSTRMLTFLKNVKIECMDVTWALLGGWKELLGQVFDTEEKIRQLQTCKKIKISYFFEKPEDAIQAIYLQGFIASRMGWEVKADEISHQHQKALCYHYQGQDINVILNPILNSAEKSGSIIDFEVFAKDGTVYTLNKKNLTKVVLNNTSDVKCEMPCIFALSDINRGFNFLKEVFYQQPGNHYSEMLAMVSKIDWEK